jgi:hypothetical protein
MIFLSIGYFLELTIDREIYFLPTRAYTQSLTRGVRARSDAMSA